MSTDLRILYTLSPSPERHLFTWPSFFTGKIGNWRGLSKPSPSLAQFGTSFAIACGQMRTNAKILIVRESHPVREITALILTSCSEQLPHSFDTQSVVLVDCAHHSEPLTRIRLAPEPNRFHHPI